MSQIVASGSSKGKVRVCDVCVRDHFEAKPVAATPDGTDGGAAADIGGGGGATTALPGAEGLPAAQLATPDMSKRQHIAHELFSTELTYVTHLTTLKELFVDPMLADAESRFPTVGKICHMTSADKLTSMNVFLVSVRQLQTLNTQLYTEIYERICGWTDDLTIGDIFCKFAPLFPMYSNYSHAHEFASFAFANGTKKSRDFAEFVQSAESQPRVGNHTLQSLLIMPIQRVLRYNLLLTDMLKDLQKKNPDHPDVPLLTEALQLIQESASLINDVIKVRENQQQVLELDASWSGYQCSSAGRMLVRQGELVKRCRRADKPFYYVLFSDVLIYGSDAKSQIASRWVHHREIPLTSCKVIELEQEECAFQVFSDRKAFVVLAGSPAERQQWVQDCQKAIAEAKAKAGIQDEAEKSAFAAVWTPDHAEKRCSICSRNFSLMYRRHHCRRCGRLACDPCTTKRMILPHIDAKKPVRVCDECARKAAEDPPEAESESEDESTLNKQGSQAGWWGGASTPREREQQPAGDPAATVVGPATGATAASSSSLVDFESDTESEPDTPDAAATKGSRNFHDGFNPEVAADALQSLESSESAATSPTNEDLLSVPRADFPPAPPTV